MGSVRVCDALRGRRKSFQASTADTLMMNFLSRIRRLHAKIVLLPHAGLNAHDRANKFILPRRIFGKANKASVAQRVTDYAVYSNIPPRSPKLAVPSNHPLASGAAEMSDVEIFRSDLESMLASMSAALARNQWQSDGADGHVSDPASTLESDVADAIRQLSIRAIGV